MAHCNRAIRVMAKQLDSTGHCAHALEWFYFWFTSEKTQGRSFIF